MPTRQDLERLLRVGRTVNERALVETIVTDIPEGHPQQLNDDDGYLYVTCGYAIDQDGNSPVRPENRPDADGELMTGSGLVFDQTVILETEE